MSDTGMPDDTPTHIPVPKPRTLSRTQSPNSGDAFGGSAPIKPSFLSERGPTPEPRPRSKTPSSAEGSKNQSPSTSGSDIAMVDSSRSDSLSSQKSVGVANKPAPPPKPAKIALLNEKSTEAYKFSTLPYGRGAAKGSRSPPKPIKQFSVPNGNESPTALSQSIPSRTPQENEAKKIPPKPVRNFASKADWQPEGDTTPLSSAGTRRPGNGGGDTGETPPTSGSGSGQAASSSPPTPRQRPPPKPARSIKRKPQRDKAVNRGGEEQTSPSEEAERPESGSISPTPRSNSNSSDKVVTAAVGETTPTSSGTGGPPKPIRRIKIPKVVDSSSPQIEEEKERSNKTFSDRDRPSSSGSGTGDGNETGNKHAVRTINVSTPSPTSSSPTNTNEEGGNSFAKAATFGHDTSASTAEVTKSTNSRFETSGGNTTPLASRSGSGSKPRPMPKPRGLQQLGSQGSETGSGSSSTTPKKPVPPSKPSQSSIRVATPEHRT